MEKANLGLLILLFSACTLVTGCSDDEDAVVSSSTSSGSQDSNASLGASTPTGVITADGFFMLFNPGIPPVYDSELFYTQQEAKITVYADDFNDLVVTSGQIVNFKTEWGTFVDSDSCIISDGHCTVTWRSGAPSTSPTNCAVSITAWTEGEETFFDANGNNQFDQTESFLDLGEPFLDINENGTFDPNAFSYELIGEFIDIINFTGSTPGTTNGLHDSADGMYTGSLCAVGNTLCTEHKSMIIHTRSGFYIQEKFDEPSGEDTNGNGIPDEKQIRFCG